MSVLICVSADEAEARALVTDGPRRDFVELARRTGGELCYGRKRLGRGGLLGRLFGPHVRHAWRAAALVRRGDLVFADGEHLGVPLLVFLALRRRRPQRVVMLGHLPGRRWKRLLFWVTTRLGTQGSLLVHSAEQARLVAASLGRSWRVRIVPYQVDTQFWAPEADCAKENPPLVLAVGSEHRDYGALVRAAAGLDARVMIAAGSHWARRTAAAGSLPANVKYVSQPLSFAKLREMYARATAVVVPLEDAANQSGITTMLEAMSCGLPLIVTASRGQRECVRGPLVSAGGHLDRAATSDRGPHWFDASLAPGAGEDTGLYVPVGDAEALRAALRLVLNDKGLAQTLGRAARTAVEAHFTIEQYVERLADALLADEIAEGRPVPAGEWP